ncbi:MAG: dTDP-4-dehydrorhamnose reductase [Pseudomonadota bacterium]
MKLLVFGQTGQVARALARLAPEARFVSRVEADLAKPRQVAALLATAEADAIINAAAYTAVDRAEEERDFAMAINGAAVGTMAEHAADRGIPFVHISTDYVFDGQGHAPWTPNTAPGPLGVYGHSKLAGEALTVNAGGTYAILRTSWVFSADGANFVKTMLRLSESRDHFTIVADQVGGPTAAADIAAACLAMVTQLHADPGKTGTYHFAGAPDVSWADFAREIFAQSGQTVAVEDIPTSAYPTPAARPANSRLDCSSLTQTFGIARPDWRASLADVLAELSETPS